MSNTVVLQLLRTRPLKMDVVSLTSAKGFNHSARWSRIYNLKFVQIQAAFIAGVFKHGRRLNSGGYNDLLSSQLRPRERGIFLPSCQKKPIFAVDLREVNGRGRLPFFECVESLAWSGLDNVGSTRV